MIKNKWMFATFALVVCTVAALATLGKLGANSASISKFDNPLSVTTPAPVTNHVAEAVTPSATQKIKGSYDPFASKSPDVNVPKSGVTMSEFLDSRHTPQAEATDLLPGMVSDGRDEPNPLDITCNIIQNVAGAASGFLNAGAGYQFSAWINPTPSCAGTPDFPYRIDSVRFQIANAATFGITGTGGAGTATYRVNIYSTSNCSTDSCGNPGNVLCSSQLISFTTTNVTGGLVNMTVPVNCCVNGPFFSSVEYVSWTGAGDNGGTGGAFRSLWPSILWSATARPLCEQWVFNGCTWIDHSSFFTAPANGFYVMTVYGESNAACTPITCATEQVCDITCPGGSVNENEPVCANEYVDVTNGGCFAVAENFTNIACGQTFCGTSGTFTVGGINNSDDDFYRFTLASTTDITWSATGEFCILAAIFQAGPTGFECDSAIVLDVATAPACSTATISLRLTAGTYYGYVSTALTTGVTCGTPYYASLGCETVTCQPDFTTAVTCAGASPLIQGTTVGAGDPCGIGIEGELWQMNVTQAGRYSFSGCSGPEAYDQRLYLFDQTGCCVSYIEENDDSCGTVGGLSFIRCVNLTAGTYFLLVSGFAAGDVGAYAINVSCCATCVLPCTPNEGEPVCSDNYVDNFNGGCNATPPVYSAISCGQTVCGTSGTYTFNDTLARRDLDWYSITVTDTTQITWTVTAEFVNNVWIISAPTCANQTVLGFSTAYECSTNTASACVDAGTYYLVTGPATFEGVACGSKYTANVTCGPCIIPPILDDCPAGSAFSQPIDPPDSAWTFGVSDIQGGLERFESFNLATGSGFDAITFWGIQTQAATFDSCDEEPMTFIIKVFTDSSSVGPDFSTGPTCSLNVALTRTRANLIYTSGALVLPAYQWTYTFPPCQCCQLTNGWISIQSTSVGAPDNCRFLWGSSGGATGGSSLLYTNGVLQAAQTFDLSLCLAPCFPHAPVNNLTVYLAPGNASAWLNFNAPQAGTYLIYSTTNTNADENPDNGADPNYTLEATQFFTAGSQSWTAPAGFTNFKKYVVTVQCE